jgi:hypothetical protein
MVVAISGGEYLQYLISSAAAQPRFSLTDANTGEIILSDRVPPTLLWPSTFLRLWPVVGDLPQREASLVLEMHFAAPGAGYTFQVQHHQTDGAWNAMIDIDFVGAEAGEDLIHKFKVLAQ